MEQASVGPLAEPSSAALLEETLDLLLVMFDAYEIGPDCYEDPKDYSGYLGKAVRLDDATFHRIAALLNERRPRNQNAILSGMDRTTGGWIGQP